MQGDAAMRRQRLEEFAHQFGVEGADLRRREGDVPDQERPPRQVERAAHQRVVHRQAARAVAADAALVAQRLAPAPGRARCRTSSTVWWSSMCRSPLAAHRRCRSAQWRASWSSMWSKKPTPVGHVVRSGAVERDRHGDRRLVRGPGDLCQPHLGLRLGVPGPYRQGGTVWEGVRSPSAGDDRTSRRGRGSRRRRQRSSLPH